MYTIYTDKAEDFKCKITVEGSEISKTKSRLVLEGSKYNLLFEGEIDSDGNCIVPIKKVKDVLSENETGVIRLEVISDDTFFSPWEDEFEVKTSKKVTVEFEDKSKKPVMSENKISVNVEVPKRVEKPLVNETKTVKKSSETKKSSIVETGVVDHGKVISDLLYNEGIKISNIKENINKANKIIKKYVSDNNVKISSETLSEEIIKNLKF